MAELLIDSMPLMSLSLEEGAPGKGDKVIMRGQFARSDKATENKRLYRETLWRREFGRLAEAMGSRRMFGELDHPADGRTKLQRVSHLVTSLQVKGNEVIGEAEVLDTPNGRILKTLAKAKAQVGVSSRGYGSTKTLPDGTQEVQEDFRLDTFDFVADPATKTAYPGVFAEEREHIREAEMELTPDILKNEYPGLVEALAAEFGQNGGALTAHDLTEAEARGEKRAADKAAIGLRRAMELAESEIYAQVRSELMSDPKVAGASRVVEQIVGLVKSFGVDPQAQEELAAKDDELAVAKKALEDRTLEVHKLQKEAEQSSALIKELAYKLRLEQLLGKDPARKAIEALLGDVTKFESKEEVERKVETIRAELDRRGGPPPSEEDSQQAEGLKQAREELEAAKTKVSELEASVEKANKAKEEAETSAAEAKVTAEKALGIAENFEARLHAEVQMAESGMLGEDRGQLRKLCEDAKSVADVDALFESFVPQRTQDGDEATRIRDRVGRGKSHDQRLEEEGARPKSGTNGKGGPDLTEVGVTGGQGEFDRLAGTGGGRA